MGKQDLRTWIAEIEAAGELQHVTGADRDEEIGGIVDFYQRRTGNPAILFDDVPGYAKGHRVLANILIPAAEFCHVLDRHPLALGREHSTQRVESESSDVLESRESFGLSEPVACECHVEMALALRCGENPA